MLEEASRVRTTKGYGPARLETLKGLEIGKPTPSGRKLK